MGIEMIARCTCDFCGAQCGKNDGRIKITLQEGSKFSPVIAGELRLYIPYGLDNGIICENCKLIALKKYIAEVT